MKKAINLLFIFLLISALPAIAGTIAAKSILGVTEPTELILTFVGGWIGIILLNLLIVNAELNKDNREN